MDAVGAAGDVCVGGMPSFLRVCAVASGHGSALCHVLQRSTTGMAARLDMQCNPQQLVCPSSPRPQGIRTSHEEFKYSDGQAGSRADEVFAAPSLDASLKGQGESWLRVPRLG